MGGAWRDLLACAMGTSRGILGFRDSGTSWMCSLLARSSSIGYDRPSFSGPFSSQEGELSNGMF